MKLAYWPGCVSRGFTPELHGSMAPRGAQARPRAGGARPGQLLRRGRHRRAQPGAGRHAQRPHVRDGPEGRWRGGHDEHLLHLPGRPVASARSGSTPTRRTATHVNAHLSRRGPLLRARRRVVEQELPLAARGGDRARQARARGGPPARGAAHRALLRLLHRAPHRAAGLSTSTPTATSTSTT